MSLGLGDGTDEPRPRLEPAAAAIVERLAVRPVVALGEVHWLRQGMDLILALAADSAFRGVADGIVVEFGATVHQELIDRYIAGEPVTDPIEPVWRDAMGGWAAAPGTRRSIARSTTRCVS